jgi:hypothetical protein
MLEVDNFIHLAQERERGIDHRRASPRQIVELYTILTGVEEAGKGLGTTLADVGVRAEGQPRLGHALEAAERHVGHPREDLDEGPLGEARRSLLLLLLVFLLLLPHLQMGDIAQFRFPVPYVGSKI